jgi:hypothetical protein
MPRTVLVPAALAVAGLVVAAASGSARERTPAPAAATRLDLTGRGVSLAYPANWYVTTRPLDVVIDPHTVIAVTSYRPPRGPRAPCDGTRARGRPVDGAFVLVKEVIDGASRRRSLPRVAPKPRRFVLPRSGRAGCLPPISRTYWFRASRRVFLVFVSIGPRASAATRLAARHVLESLTIARR